MLLILPWSTLLWYRCYYAHRSRDALSPVCGIFSDQNQMILKGSITSKNRGGGAVRPLTEEFHNQSAFSLMHPNSPNIVGKKCPKTFGFGQTPMPLLTENSKKVGSQKVSQNVWFALKPPPFPYGGGPN